MIHPNSIVKWIDTAHEVHYETTLDKLFSLLPNKIVRANGEIEFVDLERDPTFHNVLVVQDVEGYSEILRMTKLTLSEQDYWLRMHAEPYSVDITPYTLIKTYDPAVEPNIGEAGEMIQRYVLKNPEKMSADHIQVYNEQRKLKLLQIPSITKIDDSCNYGYELVTASRFCTVNGITMFASDAVTIDELMDMGFMS